MRKKRQANIENLPRPLPLLGYLLHLLARRAQVFVTPHSGVCLTVLLLLLLLTLPLARSNGLLGCRRCQIVAPKWRSSVSQWRLHPPLINYTLASRAIQVTGEWEGGRYSGNVWVICLLSIFVINIRGAAKYAAATCLAYLMAYFLGHAQTFFNTL